MTDFTDAFHSTTSVLAKSFPYWPKNLLDDVAKVLEEMYRSDVPPEKAGSWIGRLIGIATVGEMKRLTDLAAAEHDPSVKEGIEKAAKGLVQKTGKTRSAG